MPQPLARFVLAAFAPILLTLPAAAQCDECGARTAEQRAKKSKPDRRGELPKTGHPQLSSGRIRGSLVEFRHGATARKLLQLEWQYPKIPESGGALSPKEALALVNGKNRKPLLVVRTCGTCGASSHPVLDREQNDELRLLCRWFRLVRVPAEASRPGHPLHALFGEDAEHAFACHWTGAGRVDIDHRWSPGRFKATLKTLIAEANEKKPGTAVRSLLTVLARLDKQDQAQVSAERQIERESTKPKASRAKIAKLRTTVEKTTKQREATLAGVEQLSDLGLLPFPKLK